MVPPEVSLAFVVALGLIIGSYLNVVIYRLPRGASTVYPGSRCPRCAMPVRPWDNVPVLGFLWLLARCRDCGVRISVRYPLVEAGTGAWFAFCHLRAASVLEQVVASVLGAILIVLALIDFDHLKVPTRLVVTGIVFGLVLQRWLRWTDFSAAPSESPLAQASIGAAGAFLGVTAIGAMGRLFDIEDGLAAGDAQALAMIGAFLGWRGAVACFFIAAVLAVGTALLRLLLNRGSARDPLPFVTFLSVGAALVLALGPLGSPP